MPVLVPVPGLGRRQPVVALAGALVSATIVIDVLLPVAMDHVSALVALTLAAAALRALGAGGTRSVLGLAVTMLVAQPIFHVLGESTSAHDLTTGHGLPLIAGHLALFLALTAIIEAGERAGRAMVDGCRRLARVVSFSSVTPTPDVAAVTVPHDPPDLSHKHRERVPQPSRRGPPIMVIA